MKIRFIIEVVITSQHGDKMYDYYAQKTKGKKIPLHRQTKQNKTH